MPRVAMLQIETREDPDLLKFIEHNRKYCRDHSFQHILKNSPTDELPIYWAKVLELKRLLETGRYDYVCWMDSDAYVYQQNLDLRSFFDRDGVEMVIAPDPEPLWTSKFMAAVFMIKNTKKMHNLLNRWIGLYDASKWQHVGPWKWNYKGGKNWAGEDYEQGSFAMHLLTHPDFQSCIRSVPWYVFHEYNCHSPHPDAWCIHVPSQFKDKRSSCIPPKFSSKSSNFLCNMVVSMCTVCGVLTILILLITICVIASRQ